MGAIAKRLREQRQQTDLLQDALRDAIRLARDAGASVSEIALTAGLSVQRVYQHLETAHAQRRQ